ncbi:MAG: hypothetical protein Q9159_007608 [Coniocarpon cinnabarinum]
MDSVMLGSLTLYRTLLNRQVFNRAAFVPSDTASGSPVQQPKLPAVGHGLAGVGAGATVSFIAAPVEHIKARLQVQYSTSKTQRTYQGPIDCASKIALASKTTLSDPAINFWAGGLSAQIFWLTSYPSDVVKQRIMTDGFGSRQQFPRWSSAANAIYREGGAMGFWKGFIPCALRAFPTNATALVRSICWDQLSRALINNTDGF